MTLRKTIFYALFFILPVFFLTAGSNQKDCLSTPAAGIISRYHSAPKGLVLEGATKGIERVTSISYDNAKNRFLINRSFYLPVKVSKVELIDIINAMAEDDRLGVSFTPAGKLLIYGKIRPKSPAVIALAKADRLLVSIIFGWKKNLRGIKLPAGWEPEGNYERDLPAISVNILKDYTLTLSKDIYFRTGIRMVNLLLPLSDHNADNGGYMAGTGKANISVSDQNNLNFLRSNAGDFMKLDDLKRAADIGETAAFARFLRDSGNLNLKKLVEHIQSAE